MNRRASRLWNTATEYTAGRTDGRTDGSLGLRQLIVDGQRYIQLSWHTTNVRHLTDSVNSFCVRHLHVHHCWARDPPRRICALFKTWVELESATVWPLLRCASSKYKTKLFPFMGIHKCCYPAWLVQFKCFMFYCYCCLCIIWTK